MANSTLDTRRSGFEFTLVLVMLGILTILVFIILYSKNPGVSISPTNDNFDAYIREKETVLNYRKDLLAIIIAAFGAWVGAGAAYFFGRENLRESANSLLQLHRQMTGAEKLKTLTVRDIPPKPMNANYEEKSTLKEVAGKLDENPAMWFVAVITGGKSYVLSNEGIYIYMKTKMDELAKDATNQTKSYSELNEIVLSKQLSVVAPEMAGNAVFSKYVNQFVVVKMGDNAGIINEEMDSKGLFLAVIKDDSGNMVQYFTTSDIRKSLLNR